jgi:hypothetical protein
MAFSRMAIMSEEQCCDYCAKPTAFAAELQPLGTEPGHRVWFCEACSRYTWTTWRISPRRHPGPQAG